MKKVIFAICMFGSTMVHAALGTVFVELQNPDKMSTEHQIVRAIFSEEWIKSTDAQGTRVYSIGASNYSDGKITHDGYCITTSTGNVAQEVGNKIEAALKNFNSKVTVSTHTCEFY